MKKLNPKVLTVIAMIVIAIVLVIAAIDSVPGFDYEKAQAKTEKLKSYQMHITTMLTINDGENMKCSYIEQDVNVYKKGKKDMRYQVETSADSRDMAVGDKVQEENSYIYSGGKYYYTYPGVQYMSPINYDAALSNITNLTNIITVPHDRMIDITTEMNNGSKTYSYLVDYNDASEHVKATLESAIGLFDGENFHVEGISASATVKNGYVMERAFSVLYTNGGDRSVELEIYTALTNTQAKIEKPDESKYVNIE